MMSGVKGRSGGKRPGSGAKKKTDLLLLRDLIDARIGETDWNSIIGALVNKAKRGDVHAFRELRACRFGQIPVASPQDLKEDGAPLLIRTISIVKPRTPEGKERLSDRNDDSSPESDDD